MSQINYLVIDSSQKQTGDTTGNFSINMSSNSIQGAKKYTKLNELDEETLKRIKLYIECLTDLS